ncbi:MAG TPA: sterol desaturase family protein, partial [Longimicrobiales bacterium]
MTIILYSIPFFFLLLGLELAYSARAGRGLHRLNDSVADLSLGVLSQISGVFTKLFSIGIYIWLENHWALGKWDNAAVNWVVAFILVDFCYYWSHRLSHHINILWAGHVVHHSSEEYNLAVALRQSSLHGLMTWIFYAPLALIGIPWQMYVSTYALNLVYQFWIHTQAVGRLSKWMEFVMNTPSHHRVHHGINPRYLDRNHGGVFIIWDRIFGTFEPEREAVVYGITQPLRSWNPLWANVHVYWDIARSFGRMGSWSERWNLLFGPPGRQPILEAKPASPKNEKYDPQIPAALAGYGLAQFMIVLIAAV